MLEKSMSRRAKTDNTIRRERGTQVVKGGLFNSCVCVLNLRRKGINWRPVDCLVPIYCLFLVIRGLCM